MNVGLQKRISFSAIHTKHKPSLDMLVCVCKQLLYRYRRGNSTQQHLEQMLLICDGKLSKIFPKDGKWLQLHDENNTPEAMADGTS